jgi:hypothetical protein
MVKKEVWDGALSLCNNQFFCLQRSGWDFAHFDAVTVKVTLVWGIDCLALQDKFLVNNPFDVKEKDKHALWSSPVLPLSVSVSLDFLNTALAFFPDQLSNHS